MKYRILFSILLMFDIVTKFVIVEYASLPVRFADFLQFKLVKNYGAAFGIFQGQRVLLTAVALFALGFLYYYYRKANDKMKYFFVFVMAGTVGNLIDRITKGGIIDFIDVGIKDLRWPTFNLADSYIMIGVILILIFHRELEETKADLNSDETNL